MKDDIYEKASPQVLCWVVMSDKSTLSFNTVSCLGFGLIFGLMDILFIL